MILLLIFAAGILVGAIGMAVLNRLGPDTGRLLPRGTFGRRPQDTATSRDLDENAGGSRHIRTHPSWRDRLEQSAPRNGEQQ
ncbi:hypothetical protein GFY24_25310 [Nocardia sp. SYP-A9097]|uniref:hypothetical protein n=1 Tax=Nocardia sp. SYP-A9097 TaxID=2663237 RepID=UPI00129BC804|nr:hypothetical protein [Nocardia sp. SYP-A9097]MRH90716.1 hypothetical protein [Nocardia sp. SYP-A9097]